ncbi:VWA domain-containing protein [Streptomyces sp. PsTaAH-124]|uniref:VWA domain-containing protein n=1 Tax=Streptomyces sp. PsTaAH-124 TaxID=1157638 RepID=UPI000360B6A7|nr:VWA domain-containing protein [Streptomyces sp. PsTaAH-124]
MLRKRDVAGLDPAERAQVRGLPAAFARRRPVRRRDIDARRTARELLRHGGEPAPPRLHARTERPRRVVLLVLSDGWERGDPRLSDGQMRRLHRVAHRVVRADPRKARPGYAPLAAGMAAALPSVDAFVEDHSLAAPERLAAVVRGADGGAGTGAGAGVEVEGGAGAGAGAGAGGAKGRERA